MKSRESTKKKHLNRRNDQGARETNISVKIADGYSYDLIKEYCEERQESLLRSIENGYGTT